MCSVEMEIGGRALSLTTGDVARQANGSCWVRYGDTVVLATAVISKDTREGDDFFPLMVDYQEKAYAAGKVPGGFIKKEGRLSDRQILGCRLIDRPLRPLFNQAIRNDIHITVTVLSFDQGCNPAVLGIIGASAALFISDIPFAGPVAAVRIGRVKGEFIINPTNEEIEASEIDIVVAGTRGGVMMVEAGAAEAEEGVILEAIRLAHEEIKKTVTLQENLAARFGPPPKITIEKVFDQDLERKTKELASPLIDAASRTKEKKERQEKLNKVIEEILKELLCEFPEGERRIRAICNEIEQDLTRRMILTEGIRSDGRGLNEIRPITCQVGILPRVHGSALFARGQTQALVAATLGTVSDEQIVDDIEGRVSKRFMLHYYFPPFCTGEARMLRGPGRREIGHGALAERALSAVIPQEADFPYTIRVVSDILESNGSTSMASVCGGTLALMDAGVPIRSACAGVAMGLVKGEEKTVILSDISGLEDAVGDMDLKVAGTREGVTALQMDLKIEGVSLETIGQAINQARIDRLFILGEMEKAIAKPREELSPYAPRIIQLTIPPEKIGSVIGQGGRTIRNITEVTGVKIDIEDDGRVTIAALDEENAIQAREMIEYLTAVAEVGKVYLGKVMRVVKFGAFVEILPGQEGLIHISELAPYRVKQVEDILKEGDEVRVKVIEIDAQGRINLSRRQVLQGAAKEDTREKR